MLVEQVINKHLEGREWLAADQFTLAVRKLLSHGLRIVELANPHQRRPVAPVIESMTQLLRWCRILPTSHGSLERHTQVQFDFCLCGRCTACASRLMARDAAGLSYDGLPNLKAWVDRVFARPAVQKGMNVPE